MLETLTLSAFADQLRSSFQVDSDPAPPIALELIQARDLGSTPRQERFSLLFQGPLDRFLPQRMYSTEHPALGRLELFLVPVGREPEGYLYEAVFNRLAGGR